MICQYHHKIIIINYSNNIAENLFYKKNYDYTNVRRNMNKMFIYSNKSFI